MTTIQSKLSTYRGLRSTLWNRLRNTEYGIIHPFLPWDLLYFCCGRSATLVAFAFLMKYWYQVFPRPRPELHTMGKHVAATIEQSLCGANAFLVDMPGFGSQVAGRRRRCRCRCRLQVCRLQVESRQWLVAGCMAAWLHGCLAACRPSNIESRHTRITTIRRSTPAAYRK